VVAELAGFFQEQDAEILIAGLICQLLEPDCGAEAGRSSSYDANIDLVHLALEC